MKRTLCLDFDGVLHDYRTGDWKGDGVIEGKPVPGALEFVEEARKHYTVVIHSSRCRSSTGRLAIWNWLMDNDFPALKVCEHKPAAEVTLDDRAICFTGEFPSIESLIAFRPWHAVQIPEHYV